MGNRFIRKKIKPPYEIFPELSSESLEQTKSAETRLPAQKEPVTDPRTSVKNGEITNAQINAGLAHLLRAGRLQ